MRHNIVKYIMAAAAVLFCCAGASAQMHPERRSIRAGNRAYAEGDYAGGEEHYREALAREPRSFGAAFNLADALVRQERYDEALGILDSLAAGETLTAQQRARTEYNRGNALLAGQKLKEAEEAYKQSLRNDPSDMDAKYNLAYVQELLRRQENDGGNGGGQQGEDGQQQQNGGGNGSGDQQQNGDGQQSGDGNNNGSDNGGGSDEQGDDNGGNGREDDRDGRGEGPDSDQDRNTGDGQNNGDSGEQSAEEGAGRAPAGISREDAESVLDALQSQEDRTRDKVNARREIGVGRSGKNW